ncbi:MAG: ATP phosphoribosyltransferase [Candidatus Marinimicrobia bacterium]|nr:ATP phosphoribosyltransferase [Candidatus Neomarinimicrobiota bacterium]MDD5583100.1 ATP phosphoribosyltransferase [Candidatus Neomarinimicrobiota bacterium]
MLTLAIQKKGRLHDNTLSLLKDCGIRLSNGGKEGLIADADNFPMRVLFLRDDDIPECINEGAADVGIVGENVILEKKKDLKIIKKLGFARCRLSIAVPKNMSIEKPADLQGLSIATSYPEILKTYLKKQNINASIYEISGSVEISPGIGLADAIFDIVSSGSTLLSNGLKEVITVMTSEAVLVGRDLPLEKQTLLDQFVFRIKAVREAERNKYILLNAPKEKLDKITKIIPGMKSPSIIPLAREGWYSIHSVISEDDFWENIEQLKIMGAEGILVIPIEKMVR